MTLSKNRLVENRGNGIRLQVQTENSDQDSIQRLDLQSRHHRKGIVRLRGREEIDNHICINYICINYIYKGI